MDNAIILKLYNGDISSKAFSASVLMGSFFSNMKEGGCQHYSMAL